MTIKVGDRIPEATVNVLKDGVQSMSTANIFDGRKVVLFSVPGAFTPTCSAKHLPSYTKNMQAFRDRGITVVCMAVNDAFVMDAWAKTQETPDDLLMLADGNANFTEALGLAMDATPFGMGRRSKRFALYAEDGIIKQLAVEAPGEFRISAAEAMLDTIG